MAKEEANALADAKFGGGLYLKDFPAKIRVLTRDPMVYSKYANTFYAFAVLNLESNTVQVLAKGPGFAKRFSEINADPDFGEDIRKIDLKVTTNGKSGMDVRYTITPVGSPSGFTKEQTEAIKEGGFDLAERIKKDNPNAIRLSQVNAGEKIAETVEPEDDVVVEDIGNGEINLDDIPF